MKNAPVLFELSEAALELELMKKDMYTYKHSKRVAALTAIFCNNLHLSVEQTQIMTLAGRLHDIGKIYTPAELLTKPENLTEKEFEVIKLHPEQGYKLIEGLPYFKSILPCVLYHHENYDGSGYPTGISRENIPYEARIMALTDAFDAMTSERAYHSAIEMNNALAEIERKSGAQFDPDLVRLFCRTFRTADSNDLLSLFRMVVW